MDLSEVEKLEPAVLDEPARLLLGMADAIEKHGLSCGGMVDREGRLCLVKHASKLSGQGRSYFTALTRFGESLGDFNGGIGLWSDSMGRTGRSAEVVAKLRSVALGD